MIIVTLPCFSCERVPMKLLFLFFSLIALSYAQAQTNFTAGVYYGVNYGKLKGNDHAVSGLQFSDNTTAGIFFRLNRHVCNGLQLSLSYDNKSSQAKGSEGVTTCHTLRYFSARLQTGGDHVFLKKHAWQMHGGVFFNKLSNAESYTTENGVPASGKVDYTARYKKADWGLTLSTGPCFRLAGMLRIELELRYDLGLRSINNFAGYNNGKIKTNYFYLLPAVALEF